MNQNFERAFQLSGQVALITGGGSGLGYATAKCMAAAGAVVVIMGRREEVLQKACAELGDTVHYIVHDITDVSAAQTVIDRIVRDYGSIDIIVNNAGRHCKKPVEEICIQDFKNLMDVHLYGGFALTQAAIPYMKKEEAWEHYFYFFGICAGCADECLCIWFRKRRTSGTHKMSCRRYFKGWNPRQRDCAGLHRYADVPSGCRSGLAQTAKNSGTYAAVLLWET